MIADGRYEPLLAVYKKSALPAIKKVLDNGERKISAVFDKVKTEFVEGLEFGWYYNINTQKDYKSTLTKISVATLHAHDTILVTSCHA